ncbi:MAG: universal stress protein [candidate division KSB1 bacterium]|nr:universal stress protein [candidate division KSB1 bacterium]
MEIKNILAPFDFYDSSRRAFIYAAALAKRFSAHLTLFHVVTLFDDDPYDPQFSFPHLDEFYKHLEEQAGGQFEKLIAENQSAGLNVSYVVQRGFSPYEEILRFAEDNPVDLIVMGTHGRTALSRFFLGSVTAKVVHHASCPVMTVRMNVKTPTESITPKFKRLLVPTDFTEPSSKALHLACGLLEEGGTIFLLHVIEGLVQPAFFAADGELIYEITPQIRDNSEALLKQSASQVPAGIDVQTVTLEGSIAHEILEYAETQSIDLIVMGTHGQNALSHLFIGSEANRVIRKACCPVITVK